MKRKWSALLLCVCLATGGLQMDSAYALEQQNVQKSDNSISDFKTTESELSFALEKDSGYSWACVTEDLKNCTVKKVEEQMDEEGNPEEVFQVRSVCEGTEFLDFSYMDKQGTVKKNLTYKVVVDSKGRMEWTKMAYYSDDVKHAVGSWQQEDDGAIFAFPLESKGAANVHIADSSILDCSDLEYFGEDWNSTKTEREWFEEHKSFCTQYILLKGKEEGTNFLTVTYCGDGEEDAGITELRYRIEVDKNLHISVMPVNYDRPEPDPSTKIITKKNGGTTGYIWNYEVADPKIAKINNIEYIPYHAYTVGGGGTDYYTVKGLSTGTTYIHFVYARNEQTGFHHEEIRDSVWYRVDVDEQKHVTITEASDDETRVSKLRFDKVTDSECSWICTTKNLKCCTVEKMETKPSDSAITEELFEVKSVYEGTELLNFSYVDKQGVVEKNVTYKVVVDSEGKIATTQMAFYSKSLKNSVEDWDKEQKPIFIFPMGIRTTTNIAIEDRSIIDDYNTRYFQKQYTGTDGSMFYPGIEYTLLEPCKEGTTTMTVTYCEKDADENEIELSKITYQLVVDKELNLTIRPMKYTGPGEDLTEGIVAKDGNPGTAYRWSYQVDDPKIADITDSVLIYHLQFYEDFEQFDGPATTYYTVKGLSQGTTEICFTYKDYVYSEVCKQVRYRIDVDEQKHITITEISHNEDPENTDVPKVTSSPAVTASSTPENSKMPEVSEKPEKLPQVSSTPAMQSNPPKTTVPPSNIPNVTASPTATPGATVAPTATQEVPVAIASATAMPTATSTNKNTAGEVATEGAVTGTKAPDVTKQEKVKVGTVKIISSIRQSVKKAALKWKKLTGAKGYQVVVATDKKFSKNTKKKNVSETKVILSYLRKGKKYYVKVRAYIVDEKGKKVYGKYSDVKILKKK